MSIEKTYRKAGDISTTACGSELRRRCAPEKRPGGKQEEIGMCPACLATLAMMVVGASSTGGLAALVVNTFRNDTSAKSGVAVGKMKGNQTKEKES